MKKANFVDGKIKKHFNVLAYDMMAMISAKTPYRHVAEKYGVGLLSIDQIQHLKEWIEKHFVFLDQRSRNGGLTSNAISATITRSLIGLLFQGSLTSTVSLSQVHCRI